ncbi:MAG TPA: proteobacterial dedicated sortase system response regulator [Thiotrichaceae bacterium]|jgi:two-component system OmpR family response regulator|nr:proteobacterial dedicated sortase system response regulator [Thiotrichaceae bacterium]HIM08364.1 proteobacterial dedicated sortase system response regulator [Gammaproteobacteria bacterium]
MPKQIILVEDEPILCENYAKAIREQGYEVITCNNKQDALDIINKRLPDLALLDIGLGYDAEAGFDLCREIRSLSRTLPIIFLTARDSDFDTISGLRLGADDYLSKDTSMPHILARIAALFRRIQALQAPNESEQIKHEQLMVDAQCFQVEWNGEVVDLSLTEFWMVHSLVKRVGHVKNREQLMGDSNIYVDDGTITSHIKRIRKKFKELDDSFGHIETVYGIGYRWKT